MVARRPLTIALAPGAYAPALLAGLLGFGVELHRGVAAAGLAAAVAGAGLLIAVAVHEAGHLILGRHVRGLVPRILLLRRSGGASIVQGRFEDPRGAALFAAGGPTASLALSVAYVFAAALVPWPAVRMGLIVPAAVNTLLLVVNLLPVAPTDGYALLRSALWAKTGSRAEAERRAIAWSRTVLAFGLVVSLELMAAHGLAAVVALFAVTTLTVQHHAVARTVERRG